MNIPDLVRSSAAEYLRLGQNDGLVVIEQEVDDAVKSVDSAGRTTMLDEVERIFRHTAKDVSLDDADRLQVLLDIVARKRGA